MNAGYVTIEVDDFTPCLKNSSTGELIDTEVIRIKRLSFLSKYNKRNGWYTNWAELAKNSEVYALVLKGTVDIQGMISLQKDPNVRAAYIQWACTSPENNKILTQNNPRFYGVGGHLFAIAGELSNKWGFDGDVYGFAANEKLMKHYVSKLGAEPIRILHPLHFGIWGDSMNKIMEVYTYDWTDEEL